LIDDIKGIPRLFFTTSMFQHGLIQDLRDTNPRTSRPHYGNPLTPQTVNALSLGPQGPQQARQRHRPRPLNIIVKTQVMAAVLVQETLRNAGIKILKLHQSVRPSVLHGAHEFIHQVIKVLSVQSLFLHANVKIILKQFFIVRTDIQDDGKDAIGGDTTGGAVL
jgi:hypothetical protein